jgi:hypothetical protein
MILPDISEQTRDTPYKRMRDSMWIVCEAGLRAQLTAQVRTQILGLVGRNQRGLRIVIIEQVIAAVRERSHDA